MDRLRDKIAIVTGGANGIGKAIADLFAEEGAWVVVVDVEGEAGNATVAEIRQRGGSAEFCQGDVSNPSDVANAVAIAAKERPHRHSLQQCRLSRQVSRHSGVDRRGMEQVH